MIKALLNLAKSFNTGSAIFLLLPRGLSWGFPGGSDGRESACSVRDPGSILESGRAPGEGNGYPLQHSCLENSMGREAWQTKVPGSQRVRHN